MILFTKQRKCGSIPLTTPGLGLVGLDRIIPTTQKCGLIPLPTLGVSGVGMDRIIPTTQKMSFSLVHPQVQEQSWITVEL